MFNNKIQFLAIGDTVVDAFIKLNNAEDIVDTEHHKRNLCMPFGDKIPYEFAEVLSGVGNSANAAVSASRLGLRTALLTNLGDDSYAKDCLQVFKKENISDKFIKINKGKTTNYHYVLWFHNERTILIKHEEYDYTLPNIGEPEWLYLSSLGHNSLPFHEALANYLLAHPNIRLVFQPGTYQMKFGTEALRHIYQKTEIFGCNVEEAQRILNTEEQDKLILMKKLGELGPQIIAMTDGPKGSYAYDKKNNKDYFEPCYPDPKEPYERTGAGDAYTSTFSVAIALGKSIEEAMKWGAINSMSVVQNTGAQKGLLDQKSLISYLQK